MQTHDDTNNAYEDLHEDGDADLQRQLDSDSVTRKQRKAKRGTSNHGQTDQQNIFQADSAGTQNFKRKRSKGKSLSRMTQSIESVQHIYHEDLNIDKAQVRQLLKN